MSNFHGFQTHQRKRQLPQLIFVIVWEEGLAMRMENITEVKKVQSTCRNFLTKLASQAMSGVPEECIQGLPDSNQGFLAVLCGERCPREPGNTEPTSTSPFFDICKCGVMTSERCQFFEKINLSAETRGSGKMCSSPFRCQPMVPDDAIPCGRPWENQEMHKRRL